MKDDKTLRTFGNTVYTVRTANGLSQEKHGALILEIQNGQLVYKDENVMSGFKSV